MKSLRMILTTACLLAVAAFWLPSRDASAEFLRLADGTIIQGRIDSTTVDDMGLTVRRLDNGGVIRLRWNQIHAEDRLRLRREYNLEMPDFRISVTTTGDRIEMLNGDVFEGKIAGQDDRKITIKFLDDKGEWDQQSVNRNEVESVFTNVPVNALALKTPAALYNELMTQFPPQDGYGEYRMAHYCKLLGLYEKGLDHIAGAVAADPALEDKLATLRDLFTDLIAQADIRKKIEEAAGLIRRDKFGLAEALLNEILATPNLAASLKDLCTEQLAFLDSAAADEISKRWYRLIEVMANRRVNRSGTDLETAKAYATGGEMQTEILASLVASFGMAEDRINALFASRDANKYRMLRVSMDLAALEGRARNAPGANVGRNNNGAGNNGANGGGNRANQMRDLMKKIQENPEAADELRKQLEKLMGGGRSVEEPVDPEAAGRAYSFEPDMGAELGMDPVAQGRENRDGGRNGNGFGPNSGNNNGNNRNNNGGNGAANSNGGNQQQATPQEMWERASTTMRKNYVIYLYCESQPTINRVKERESNGTVQYWYR